MANATAADLCRFIDQSPSPFHVCTTVAAELDAAGFIRVHEREVWPIDHHDLYVIRGGSLIAWSTDAAVSASDGFRIIGGHTDSPNLRVKQHGDLHQLGLNVVALEPYGGAWLNSWLDRDLGISGRLSLRDGTDHLLHVNEPVLRVPQLAIHLSDNRKGVELDPQRHLNAIWGSGTDSGFLTWAGERAGVSRDDIMGFELMTHDTAPSTTAGAHKEFVSAPRLDNQGTCFAGTRAFIGAEPVEGIRTVLALFDHEEVGSNSERGAQSDFLSTVLERIVLGAGGNREDFHRAAARSLHAYGDMAHATHPNYVERHEPLHHIAIDGDPVLKVNQNLRYATDAVGARAFALACEQAGVPLQRYVHRADLPCGSTIGPIAASGTGITTVDVGAPQLAMHSAREMMGARDIEMYADALEAFLSPANA